MINSFTIGQCWVSETEPELGVCRILSIEGRRVTVYFASNQETRIYSSESAPLKRIQYEQGAKVCDLESNSFTVQQVVEKEGLLYYSDGNRLVPETEVESDVDFSGAIDRLKHADFESNSRFNLRYRTLLNQQYIRQSKMRGLVGGRIDLIPHQFYVVSQVIEQYMPRVLLADEVGLGKTIEACLIMHRLLSTGQINRVLILLPEALIHQWFIELFRRFNLTFSILDEERCQSLEVNNEGDNPFDDSSLTLCNIDFLLANPKRGAQIIKAGWDLLIVDEAHHLEWHPDSPSPQYLLVDQLAGCIERVILLSGTPEQLGIEGHFARLKLLDPDRFYDLDKFIEETHHYNEVAQIADKLVNNKPFADCELPVLTDIARDDLELSPAILSRDEQTRQEILKRLLDHYGTGRAIFRNTRHVVKGFPSRHANLISLPLDGNNDFANYLRHEFDVEKNHKAIDFDYDYSTDPRIEWLSNKLKKLRNEKVLLICHSIEKATAIEKALLNVMNVNLALFHEEMTLLQRDRNAAWFADKDGAQLLICSEIGSEGRNFQFAHHLVLYDLPLTPELLEQRIGRLDRIGQRSNIHIHIPYLENSPQEVMARWYHEGLDAIEHHIPGGHEFIKPFTAKILKLATHSHKTSDIDNLIMETREFRNQLVDKLEHGRDHLLELNSFNPDQADDIIAEVKHFDHDQHFEPYILDVFEQFGIQVEAMSRRSFLLSPANCLYPLPGLATENMTVTCSRGKALDREDISFLSWDHPLVRGGMDMITATPFGNCSFALWQNDDFQVLLEAVFILDCQAPGELHADRFLSPTPIRIVVNHLQDDLTSDITFDDLKTQLKNGKQYLLDQHPEIVKSLVPNMIEACQNIADNQSQNIINKSIKTMQQHLGNELKRLHQLQKNNANIQDCEIRSRMTEIEQLTASISQSHTRLDSLRLILKGPFEN